MGKPFLFFLLAVVGPALPAADAGADAAWQAYETAARARPAKSFAELAPLERQQWLEQRALQLRELGLAFLEQHPADPRRWSIVLEFSPDSPRFVREWGPLDAQGEPAHPVMDEPAAAAWKAKVGELRAALAKAADVPADVRQRWLAGEALQPFRAALKAREHGEAVDLPALRTRLTDYAAQNPDSAYGSTLLYYYTELVELTEPAQLEAEWQAFAASPNAGIAEKAKAKVGFYALAKRPVELAFTAADGRDVDLAKLRGKVVLIDFWATWCGPCVAELPNVKKAYAAYHDQGFEIIGIALENARLAPGDTPEQSAAKLAKARQGLLDFTAKNDMPWPQYFDGKYWKNDVSTKYAIYAIPAMFLVDRDGRIVTTVRGEKLEAEVKRLLKL